MPRKTKYTNRRKYRRRRNMRKRKTVLVNRALQPIAQRYIVKMKYAEQVTTNANGRYNFNLNSVFAPNPVGTPPSAHQPYSFDTMASLYNRYRVISCGYRISAAQQPAIAGNAFQIGAQPANEVLTYTSMSELKENPRSKYIIQTIGGGNMVLSGKTHIPSLVGRTKAQYMADDRYQATTTNNPAELAVLNILTSGNGGDTSTPLLINVLLEYTVEFFDVKHLGQS